MKYSEKQRFARDMAEAITNGQLLVDVQSDLSAKGLKSYDFDTIWRLSRQILSDQHGELIHKRLRQGQALETDPDLAVMDPRVLSELADQALTILVAEEISKARSLMDRGADYEEVVAAVNLNIYPEDAVIAQVESFNKDYERIRRKERTFTISGFFLMLIFLLTFFMGGGMRPLYLTGIAGAVLLYQSWQLRKKL